MLIPVASSGQNIVVAGGGGATFTYVTSAEDVTDGTSFTFSGTSIGTADADRTVVVVVATRGSLTAHTQSVTLGGNPMTQLKVQNSANNRNKVAIYAIDVSTGTTADIVVTSTQSEFNCVIYVYRCTGISTTPNATDGSGTATDYPGSVAVTDNGLVIAGAISGSTATTWSWSPITQQATEQAGSESHWSSTAAATFASAQTVNATCTPSGTVTDHVAAYVSW